MGNENEMTFGKSVEDTGWLLYVRRILAGSCLLLDEMHGKRRNVLVHCSDGWDRTAQICALAQMLIDPYFRTIDGFRVLIEKDWLGAGHQFQKRIGHGLSPDDEGSSQRSPIFLQFLDCVYQLIRFYPTRFEFTPRLLTALAHHLYSCRFTTFLHDCEKHRNEDECHDDFWRFVLSDDLVERVKNPIFKPSNGPLYPSRSRLLRSVTLWEEYFLRWTSTNGESSFLMTKIYDLLLLKKEVVSGVDEEEEEEKVVDGDEKD